MKLVGRRFSTLVDPRSSKWPVIDRFAKVSSAAGSSVRPPEVAKVVVRGLAGAKPLAGY